MNMPYNKAVPVLLKRRDYEWLLECLGSPFLGRGRDPRKAFLGLASNRYVAALTRLSPQICTSGVHFWCAPMFTMWMGMDGAGSRKEAATLREVQESVLGKRSWKAFVKPTYRYRGRSWRPNGRTKGEASSVRVFQQNSSMQAWGVAAALPI